MSQCTDVDAALARLGAKIDAQNKRISDLDSRKQDKDPNGSKPSKPEAQKPYDDKELRERIGKLEKDVGLLKKAAVGAVEAISDITNGINDASQAIGAIQEVLEPIIENVGSLLGFLGDS